MNGGMILAPVQQQYQIKIKNNANEKGKNNAKINANNKTKNIKIKT
jgi:hypothetical protein